MIFKTSPLRLQKILFIGTVPSSSNQQNTYSGITCKNCPIYDFIEYNSRKKQSATTSDRSIWHRADGTHAPRQVPAYVPIHKSTCAQDPSQEPTWISPIKDRIIKGMILCTNSITHPVTCKRRRTLDRIFASFPIAITDVVTLLR